MMMFSVGCTGTGPTGTQFSSHEGLPSDWNGLAQTQGPCRLVRNGGTVRLDGGGWKEAPAQQHREGALSVACPLGSR